MKQKYMNSSFEHQQQQYSVYPNQSTTSNPISHNSTGNNRINLEISHVNIFLFRWTSISS